MIFFPYNHAPTLKPYLDFEKLNPIYPCQLKTFLVSPILVPDSPLLMSSTPLPLRKRKVQLQEIVVHGSGGPPQKQYLVKPAEEEAIAQPVLVAPPTSANPALDAAKALVTMLNKGKGTPPILRESMTSEVVESSLFSTSLVDTQKSPKKACIVFNIKAHKCVSPNQFIFETYRLQSEHCSFCLCPLQNLKVGGAWVEAAEVSDWYVKSASWPYLQTLHYGFKPEEFAIINGLKNKPQQVIGKQTEEKQFLGSFEDLSTKM